MLSLLSYHTFMALTAKVVPSFIKNVFLSNKQRSVTGCFLSQRHLVWLLEDNLLMRYPSRASDLRKWWMFLFRNPCSSIKPVQTYSIWMAAFQWIYQLANICSTSNHWGRVWRVWSDPREEEHHSRWPLLAADATECHILGEDIKAPFLSAVLRQTIFCSKSEIRWSWVWLWRHLCVCV